MRFIYVSIWIKSVCANTFALTRLRKRILNMTSINSVMDGQNNEGGKIMKEIYARVEKHLYKRQYQVGGDWKTVYYTEFTDWQGIHRKFPLGGHLEDARDKLGELRTKNKGQFDWGAEKRKLEENRRR